MPTLMEIGIDIYGDTSRFDAAINNIGSRLSSAGAGAGSSFGSSFGVGFANPILNAVSGINAAIGGIETIGAMALDVTGMRTSAEIGLYRRQLTSIAGDAGIAEKAIQGFVDTANSSSFDTDQVMRLGLRQAGKTGDVAGSVAATNQILDTAAAIGVTNGTFERFAINLDQMRDRGAHGAGFNNITQMRGVAGSVDAMIAKSLNIPQTEATRRINKATGKEIIDMLNAVGNANKGAASRMASSDPMGAGANILDSLKNGMAPTGGIFNAVLTPLMIGIKGVADVFGSLNTATGGFLGLVGVVAGGTIALRYFGGAAFTAIGATRGLTAALLQMAGSAEIAAGANRTGAISNIGSAVGGAAGAVGGAAGLTGLAKTFGMFGRVANFAKAIGPGLIATVAALGLNAAGNSLYNQTGASTRQRSLGAGINAAGTGLGIGGGIGMFFGPLGILIGGVLGTFGGWMTGIISEKIKQNKEAADKKAGISQDRHTKAMEDHTDALKTTSRMIGGGSIGSAALSMVERELAIYNMARGNAVGVG